MIPKELREFHFNGSTTSYHCVVLNSTPNDHDGVMQGSFGLFHELFSATSENDSASLGLGHTRKKVESLSADLLFFKEFAFTKSVVVQIVDRGLDGSTTSLKGYVNKLK